MAVTVLTVQEHAQRLADYLPGGRLFDAKNRSDSNLLKLLTGIAYELFTAEGYLRDYRDDIIPDATIFFLDEWEEALGIPDSCFTGTGSLNERRRDILLKLASLGLQTASDFEEIGALFGLTVTVEPAYPHAFFPMVFPLFLGTAKEARFTIFVTFTVSASSRFPLTFPFVFGDASMGVVECLFRRLKPANCDIIFQQV